MNVLIRKNENIYLSVSYDFKSSMGPRKSRCDVPNGTTYKWVCHEGHIIYLAKIYIWTKKLGKRFVVNGKGHAMM
jgi:hypothetical protein